MMTMGKNKNKDKSETVPEIKVCFRNLSMPLKVAVVFGYIYAGIFAYYFLLGFALALLGLY